MKTQGYSGYGKKIKILIYDNETNTLIFKAKIIQILYKKIGFFWTNGKSITIVIQTTNKKEYSINLNISWLMKDKRAMVPLNVSSCLNHLSYTFIFSLNN